MKPSPPVVRALDAPPPAEPGRTGFTRPMGRAAAAYAQLAQMRVSNPMVDVVVDEVAGRRIRVGDQWLADFASCNYLGFDLRPDIAAAIGPYVALWGTHPSWSRMIAGPRVFEEIESELAALLGTQDSLLLPTITHIHMSAIPALVDEGDVYVDTTAHRTIQDGAAMARARGATVHRFRLDQLDRLAELLSGPVTGPRLVCTDGVNSMTGNLPPLAELARLTRANDALLYVDDAHGFGVVGERRPDELSPYGSRGNGLVRHLGVANDGIILVGGFSKAYSSLLAFVACSTEIKNFLKATTGPYTFSGPPPTASLATAQVGLAVNRTDGDAIRADLHRKTRRVLDGVAALGAATLNTSGFPIIETPMRNPADVDPVGHFLFERGILATLAPYPVVRRADVGFRLQVTAANTDEEIDHLLATLADLADRYPLRGDLDPA